MAADGIPHVVTVEIQGLRYPIRSALDPAYIADLASYVDRKIDAAVEESRSSDSGRLAVLAALNIADEYFRSRDADGAVQEELARWAEALERLVDRAVAVARSE